MSNIYKSGLFVAVLLCLPISSIYAQLNTPVGLDAHYVRMSDLQQMEKQLFAPAQQLVNTVTSNNVANTEPQQDDQFLGIGIVYGEEIERIGLQLNYFYFLTAALALGGDFTFFLPETFDTGTFETTVTFFTLNVLAHYYFFANETLRAYALGGLNFAISRVKVRGGGASNSDSASELGLNLGGGLEFALAAGFLYLELKYILGEFDQLVLGGGYRFRI